MLKRKKLPIRTMLLTVLMATALVCIGIFFTSSAAGEETVSGSDVRVITASVDFYGKITYSGNTEGFNFNRRIESKNTFFKPDAEYNGSYRSMLTDMESDFYDILYEWRIMSGMPLT